MTIPGRIGLVLRGVVSVHDNTWTARDRMDTVVMVTADTLLEAHMRRSRRLLRRVLVPVALDQTRPAHELIFGSLHPAPHPAPSRDVAPSYVGTPPNPQQRQTERTDHPAACGTSLNCLSRSLVRLRTRIENLSQRA